MNPRLNILLVFFIVLNTSCETPIPNPKAHPDNWAWYQGGPDVNQYSELNQISTENVAQLEVAWAYETGDKDTSNRSQIQCNPLIIDGILYGTSAKLKLFALDATTGKELWHFDPFEGNYQQYGMGVNRGLSYWFEGEDKRILFTAGAFIYAINAENGSLVTSFGESGRVDLHTGLGEHAQSYFINANTPGIIYKDLLIQGSRVSESTEAAPGYIRAFNVKTGALEWTFNTIPKPGEYGHETWPEEAWKRAGGANSWSGISLDPETGIVYVPTGSAAYDFYGGDRHGENLFANCVLALNANTGERIWHYQIVRHDLWDRDLPAPPNVITVNHDGKRVRAIAQITKSGHIFLLDAATGIPLFPIQELDAPPSTLEGEKAWPKQALPLKPPAFTRQDFKEEDLPKRSQNAHDYAKAIWQNARLGPFAPPGEQTSILMPGFDGGGEWGGAAADQDGILYVNNSEMPWLIRMLPHEQVEDNLLASRGKQIYSTACMTCHGKEREGSSAYGNSPSLIGLKDRKSEEEVIQIIQNGKGIMPAFTYIKEDKKEALLAFLFESEAIDTTSQKNTKSNWPYPYIFEGYKRFYAPDGYPAITPPWGSLSAVDLNKGEILWKVTVGTHQELLDQGLPPTGTEMYGGPIVTAGNVIFLAATMDEKIRAFDKRNGQQLWEAQLPAAGYATPATYAVNGKQYVVIAAGGGKLGTKSGDTYVAFSLP